MSIFHRAPLATLPHRLVESRLEPHASRPASPLASHSRRGSRLLLASPFQSPKGQPRAPRQRFPMECANPPRRLPVLHPPALRRFPVSRPEISPDRRDQPSDRLSLSAPQLGCRGGSSAFRAGLRGGCSPPLASLKQSFQRSAGHQSVSRPASRLRHQFSVLPLQRGLREEYPKRSRHP